MDNLKFISFSSAKGGVGRTMTLANLANIYANGSASHGISPKFTLLMDLDFHAPGIHYYAFAQALTNGTVDKTQREFKWNNNTYSVNQWSAVMESNRIGLIYLLTDILGNKRFIKKSRVFSRKFHKNTGSKIQLIQEYKNFLAEMLTQEEFNPYNHMISSLGNNTSIFLIPAGSPGYSDFNKTVFDFNWHTFLTKHSGVFLIDAIARFICHYYNKDNELEARVLLDQQAGVSIASSINSSISDASILIGGLNEQNKEGLKSMIKAHEDMFDEFPWMILNQYKYRSQALQKNLFEYGSDHTSPIDRFYLTDKKERTSLITDIAGDDNTKLAKIAVIDFEREAVQKEYFYHPKSVAYAELIALVVKVEKSFSNSTRENRRRTLNTPKTIVLIGERLKYSNSYSGPLKGLYASLRNYAKNTKIIGLAATHKWIVSAVKSSDKTHRVVLTFGEELIEGKHSLSSLSGGIYDLGDYQEGVGFYELSMDEIDIWSYPYYVVKDIPPNFLLPIRLTESDLIPSDSLKELDEQYLQENIIRWAEYSLKNGTNEVTGVPLWVGFQLLAFHKAGFGSRTTLRRFREKYNREFSGFSTTADLIDFAQFVMLDDNYGDKLKNVSFLRNYGHTSKWYEWQTIFGMFYEPSFNAGFKSFNEYVNFLLKDEAIFATREYLKFTKRGNRTSQPDQDDIKPIVEDEWHEQLQGFYFNDEASLILVWADSVPCDLSTHHNLKTTTKNPKREDEVQRMFLYQPPPSHHYFEECWVLSLSAQIDPEKAEFLKQFILYFLTPEGQQCYLDYGGLPTHKSVISRLDNWLQHPLLPCLYQVYFSESEQLKLVKRDAFRGLSDISTVITKCLEKIRSDSELRIRELYAEFFSDSKNGSKDFDLINAVNDLKEKENQIYDHYIKEYFTELKKNYE